MMNVRFKLLNKKYRLGIQEFTDSSITKFRYIKFWVLQTPYSSCGFARKKILRKKKGGGEHSNGFDIRTNPLNPVSLQKRGVHSNGFDI